MGERMKDTRRVSLPLQCVGCGCVKIGQSWNPDRRAPSIAPYPHGLCPTCRANYILEGLALAHPRKG